MDPATHALFGAALAVGASPAPRRAVVLTCAGASLLPDIDAVVMPAGWDRYLVAHEIGTHSLPGAVLLGALLALILCWCRPAWKRGAIWAAAIAGTVGHVFWDLANGGDIRVFWPVSSLRIGGHLAAMADPVVLIPLLMFGFVALVWRRHVRVAADVVLLALAGVLVARAGLQDRALEAHARAVVRSDAEEHPAEEGSGTVPRAIGRGTVPSTVSSVRDVSSAHAARLWAMSGLSPADQAGHRPSPIATSEPAIARRAIEAEWGALAGWWVYDRTADAMRVWHVDGWTGEVVFSQRVSVDQDSVEAVANVLRPAERAVALWDFAFVRRRPYESGEDVLLSDLRFCISGKCGVWFGGHLDATGQPREEVVIVGPWRLTRPIGR
jgi:membrane-bound metal-dependent hydrolase YbcI (DUF457 family)